MYCSMGAQMDCYIVVDGYSEEHQSDGYREKCEKCGLYTGNYIYWTCNTDREDDYECSCYSSFYITLCCWEVSTHMAPSSSSHSYPPDIDVCTNCGNLGYIPTCSTCGVIYEPMNLSSSEFFHYAYHMCSKCSGSGTIVARTCYGSCTSSHRYCNHYSSTTLTSHAYCSHGYTSQHI